MQKSSLGISENSFNKEEIPAQMNIFFECYKTLTDMAKYKINIFGNNMIRFSDASDYAPELQISDIDEKDNELIR